MTQTLHVVMGTTGEYSDRREWPVRAFLSDAQAEEFVAVADAWLREHKLHSDHDGDLAGYFEGAIPCPFDSAFSVDYTGTSYYIMPVPLDDDVRQDIAATVVEDVEAGRLPKRALALDGKL